MPMLPIHPACMPMTARQRQSTRDAARRPSRRQQRARITAMLNGAAVFFSLAGIALILVLA